MLTRQQFRRCGWLVDKFGASWQLVPRVLIVLIVLITGADAACARRAMAAMMTMKKIDIATLERASAAQQ